MNLLKLIELYGDAKRKVGSNAKAYERAFLACDQASQDKFESQWDKAELDARELFEKIKEHIERPNPEAPNAQ